MEEVFITEAKLSVRWGVSKRTLRNRRERGEMPAAYRNGRRGGFGQGVSYRLADIIEIEESQKEPSNAD